MGQKLPEDQMKLYRRIDEVLFYVWDPIGVSPSWARDEYQSYLPKVFRAVMNNTPRKELRDQLINIEAEYMGMGKRFGMKKRIAGFVDLLYELKDEIIEEGEQGGAHQSTTRSESKSK